ncbi:hypothetical protein Rwratislav_41965 [Rhodococcus wratislaviensis IFP 2016]|nr:hypothetical protein Rwratislav_41965 [Rhodococcus wratislaviensis IFP 2016]
MFRSIDRYSNEGDGLETLGGYRGKLCAPDAVGLRVRQRTDADIRNGWLDH